jgi:hypothetical protein
MAFSDFEATYGALDDGPLLALNTVLGAEYERFRCALDKHTKAMERESGSALELGVRFRETLAELSVLADGVPNPDFHAGVVEFRAGMREVERRSERSAVTRMQMAEDLATHAGALLTRQRHVVDELARRGLLPVFPLLAQPAGE